MSENRKTALLSVVLFAVCFAAGIALTGNRDRSPATSGETNTQTIQAQALEQAPDFLAMNRGELIAVLGTYDDATLRRTIRSISRGGSAIDPRRQSALRTAMNLLAERDPAHFLRWIDTAGLPPGLAVSAVETAATLLAAGDPEEGFAALKEIGSFQMRRTAMLAYGAALAEHEPETVLRQLTSVGWGTDGARIVGSTMAARDPEEAANFFAGLHQASNYSAQIGLKYVMPQWARTDPEAAFKWANAGGENWYSRHLGTISLKLFREFNGSGLERSQPMCGIGLTRIKRWAY
ncbi:MAG: hypothetical protein KDN22_09985 [Verrucomicrobiae bacterium]|nr:hypothetical protein [Verrucomicrobiae bacterium]